MSAPSNAKPLGYKGWSKDEDGKEMMTEEEVKNNPDFKVKCSCGWKGHLAELLAADGDDNLWCPQCRTIGWEYE